MLISIAFTNEELKTVWTALIVGSTHVESEKLSMHMLELSKRFEIIATLRKDTDV